VKSSILQKGACRTFCCNTARESKTFHQKGYSEKLLTITI